MSRRHGWSAPLLTALLLVLLPAAASGTASFAVEDDAALSSGDVLGRAAVLSPDGLFGIFASSKPPPNRVVKVDLATLTRSASLDLSGIDRLLSAVSDGTYAYFGSIATSGTSVVPGRVVKVDISGASPTYVGDISLGAGSLISAVIDPEGDFAYFGTNDTPARIIKVQLSGATCSGGETCGGMAVAGSLTLVTGENALHSAVIAPDGKYAYFGTFTSPARIVKIDLSGSHPVRSQAIELDPGENLAYSAVMEQDGSRAHFGLLTSPGRVVTVDLTGSLPVRDGALTLEPGEDSLVSAVLADTGGAAFFGTNTNPAQVVKVDLAGPSPQRVGGIDVGAAGTGGAVALLVAADRGFAVTAATSGSVSRVVRFGLGLTEFSAPPTSGPTLIVSCGPEQLAVGVAVDCTVDGGPPEFDIVWAAATNPRFAEGVVRTDVDGKGTFRFIAPRAAAGATITVEMVAWTLPEPIGMVAGIVPSSVPAGAGPSPSPAPLFLVLVAVLLAYATSQTLPASSSARRSAGFDAFARSTWSRTRSS